MESMLSYLSELEQNNNRDWYHAHKKENKAAVLAFENLVAQLLLEIGLWDDRVLFYHPSELTFRLTRDTRFGADKSPYRPAFRAHIGPQGKISIPVGYFIYLQPGGRSFLGAGLFTDFLRDATLLVRQAIAARGEEWRSIVEHPDFAGRFSVYGTALKNVPKDFNPGHPQGEYLKHKSWYLEYPVQDEQVLSPDFPQFAADTFRAMKPFNDFLNQALADFQWPEHAY